MMVELTENFEIYTANSQYRKEFIDKCVWELKIALTLQSVQELSACQQFVLQIPEVCNLVTGENND